MQILCTMAKPCGLLTKSTEKKHDIIGWCRSRETEQKGVTGRGCIHKIKKIKEMTDEMTVIGKIEMRQIFYLSVYIMSCYLIFEQNENSEEVKNIKYIAMNEQRINTAMEFF